MDECIDCERSKVGHWGAFTWSCQDCRARHVSRTPDFFRSRKEGRQTDGYRKLLRMTGLTHEQVKAAAELDAKEAA